VNFLTLVRETLNDAGVGTSSSVTSVGSLTDGHAGMVKRAVVEAWLHIQNLDDAWTFMQGSGEIVIRDGVSRYPVEEMGLSLPFGLWRYLNADREIVSDGSVLGWDYVDRAPGTGRGTARIDAFPYTVYQPRYRRGVEVVRSRSVTAFAVEPGTSAVWVGPEPDRAGLEEGSAVLFCEYKSASQRLGEDEDVPRGLPERYHQVIKWLAIREVQMYDESSGSVQAADMHYREHLNGMRRELLPRGVFGG